MPWLHALILSCSFCLAPLALAEDVLIADYRHEQWIDNHYGASRRGYEGANRALYDRLGVALSDMRVSGEIELIYSRHGVMPPDSPLD